MDTGTKIVTHAGMRMGTGIFSNCGYGEGDYIVPYPYPTHCHPYTRLNELIFAIAHKEYLIYDKKL
jgi:hypothetical protein